LSNLCTFKPKQDVETGDEKPWVLKDLRKTCATCYDAQMPESSIETLGHSVGGGTYRHYAHRDPLAFKAIMSLPQPTAFASGRLINVVRNADGLAVFDPPDRPALRNIEALGTTISMRSASSISLRRKS
jgi:hypothetical protein